MTEQTMINFGQGERIQSELDDLFGSVRSIRSSEAYLSYLGFLSRFRKYSVFNTTLVYLQKPDTSYFATKKVWWDKFKRTVKYDARSLIMLQPGGPVMFVYDLNDTEGDDAQIPEYIRNPYTVTGSFDYSIMNSLSNRLKELEIKLQWVTNRVELAGSVKRKTGLGTRFSLELNKNQSKPVNLLTLIHELAHITCGHLGSMEDEKWPDRKTTKQKSREFEAESVVYLLTKRLGLKANSDKYLSGYLEKNDEIPEISIERVIRSVELIEKFLKSRKLKLYKE